MQFVWVDSQTGISCILVRVGQLQNWTQCLDQTQTSLSFPTLLCLLTTCQLTAPCATSQHLPCCQPDCHWRLPTFDICSRLGLCCKQASVVRDNHYSVNSLPWATMQNIFDRQLADNLKHFVQWSSCNGRHAMVVVQWSPATKLMLHVVYAMVLVQLTSCHVVHAMVLVHLSSCNGLHAAILMQCSSCNASHAMAFMQWLSRSFVKLWSFHRLSEADSGEDSQYFFLRPLEELHLRGRVRVRSLLWQPDGRWLVSDEAGSLIQVSMT